MLAFAADGHGLLGAGRATELPFGATMESTLLIEILLVTAVFGLWWLLLAFMLSWTRPKDVRALPASQDLPGEEPPAVVSLLVGRWKLNEDAAESTLIDLAARHLLEFRQPGNDPSHTTVHLLAPRPGAPAPDLTPYERQVLDHVRSQAVNGVVPMTALTFRDVAAAHRWTHRLHHDVIADARARGLTRRRFSPALVSLLSVAAAVPAGLLALVIMERGQDVGPGPGAALVTWGLLSSLAGRPLGERDTPAGREAAARWLGLKAFLRNDEAFAELPPAAVTVWDRYLSYGDALGVTRVCSALIDLGMGDRKRVWSSFGGAWHRVRVRYPRFWSRYGSTAPRLLAFAAVWLVVGVFILRSFGRPDSLDDRVATVIFLLGLLTAGNGVYRIARMGLDLAAPRTITGEVLWVELWKSTQEKENKPAVPLVHYFAVDDGRSDRTTAWAVPSPWAGQARPGDVVTFTVRPWTRRLTRLAVDSSRIDRLTQAIPQVAPGADGATVTAPPTPTARPLDPTSAIAAIAGPAGAAGGPLGAAALPVAAAVAAADGARPVAAVPQLLGVDEVSAALGRPVVTDGAAARISLGPFELVTFADPGAGTPVLVAAVARGSAVALVMRTVRTGEPLTADGDPPWDEAWRGPGWVSGRRGETMVRLTLEPGGRLDPQLLPALLGTALNRLG